jgi:hypothetical protein
MWSFLMTRPTYYDILGVDRAASPAEITRKYNEAVRRIDAAHTNSSVFAHLVTEAYAVLHDQTKRRWYDTTESRRTAEFADPLRVPHSAMQSLAPSATAPANANVSVNGSASHSVVPDDAAAATTHGADPWLVVGWWAYGASIGVLLAVAASVSSLTGTMDGDEMIRPDALGYLVLIGALGALAALVGAMCRTDTLRLQIGSSVIAIGFWGGLLSVVAVSDRAPWFWLGVIYVLLLVVGSFLIAWRRHHERINAPGWVPYTPRVTASRDGHRRH